ncbi:MAG: hypothetical protein M1840_000017 [Geoglossum simile]|nr:MAG: hypothetical protein M1840_000017 [Geoglossum simile]
MPTPSNEDQFKFLISCIRYSNNGRVDFGEVASECGIVSKGAAAKRYERMMKAHGIATAASPSKCSNSSPTKRKSPKGSPSKKRKVAEALGSVGDDEEVLSIGVKSEYADDNIIKKEPTFEYGNSGGSLIGLDLTATEYGGGVGSAIEGSSAGGVLGILATGGSRGGARESIVID